MSQINVNRIKDSNEGAPDFPSGVNVGGITSTVTLGVTNLNPTNLNVSGVVTATTLDGNLLATGTPTLGLGVTINTSGVNISGVATAGIVSATTLYGDGSNLTGIALTIAPLNYNPAVNSQSSHLTKASGIGLTFNQGVKAGSGNVTLSLANAGVAGTVVENFGVGNSVSYSTAPYGTAITITPTADLSANQDYHLNYPSGAFTNIGGDVSFVGTAYTFKGRDLIDEMWTWGQGSYGAGGANNRTTYSSPIQVPGTWAHVYQGVQGNLSNFFAKNVGELWSAGYNTSGQLGQGNETKYSSPVQIPGTTWSTSALIGRFGVLVPKTDGTLWAWGNNSFGQLGQNSETEYSSPRQIPGTTWSSVAGMGRRTLALKTNGTLWSWGYNEYGQLGLNNRTKYSSPVQVPGTTWAKLPVAGQEDSNGASAAIKTDGTLWVWGDQYFFGQLGVNDRTRRSSPTQVPGTNWSNVATGKKATMATKTDGTLWVMGTNEYGTLGQNSRTYYSSPVQIPGTNWDGTQMRLPNNGEAMLARKTDGTLWGWGANDGKLALNNQTSYSSPTQIPGTTWTKIGGGTAVMGLKQS